MTGVLTLQQLQNNFHKAKYICLPVCKAIAEKQVRLHISP